MFTFGAQATARPDHLPLAVAVPANAPDQLKAVAAKISAQGGDAVTWRNETTDSARRQLEDKDVYGVLELTPGPTGVTITVLTSGAVNPQGGQAAQQILTGAAQALSSALPSGMQATVRTEVLHPASTPTPRVPTSSPRVPISST